MVPTDSYACICRYDFEEHVEFADLIFVGKVMDQVDSSYWVIVNINGEERREFFREMFFELEVTSTFKGEVGPSIFVRTGYGGGDCGILSRIGENLLIFAKLPYSHDSTDSLSSSSIYSDYCYGSMPLLEFNREDFTYLNQSFGKAYDMPVFQREVEAYTLPLSIFLLSLGIFFPVLRKRKRFSKGASKVRLPLYALIPTFSRRRRSRLQIS